MAHLVAQISPKNGVPKTLDHPDHRPRKSRPENSKIGQSCSGQQSLVRTEICYCTYLYTLACTTCAYPIRVGGTTSPVACASAYLPLDLVEGTTFPLPRRCFAARSFGVEDPRLWMSARGEPMISFTRPIEHAVYCRAVAVIDLRAAMPALAHLWPEPPIEHKAAIGARIVSSQLH